MSDNVLSIDALRMRTMVETAPAQPRPASPARLKAVLDRAAVALRDPARVAEAWPRLLAACAELRAGLPEEVWRGRLRAHPVFEVLRAEPATAWSYRKPRGHAGDARLMDFLYGHPAVREEVEAATPHGKALHQALRASLTASGARACRVTMAAELDQVARRVRGARVLVLGAGHLREAEFAGALDQLESLVAVDQDPACIDQMTQDLAGRVALGTVPSSLRRFLMRVGTYGGFDLILAGGLFDYLDDAAAGRALRALVPALRPGGRMLFTNARPGAADEAYLDAFMDWRMFRRDEAALGRLLEFLPRTAVTDRQADTSGALIYVSVETQGEPPVV